MQSKILKKIIIPAAVLLIAAAIIIGAVCICINNRRARRRAISYSLSNETDLTFSNADEVISLMRNSLKNHDVKIILKCTARSGEHMDQVSPLISELMSCAMVPDGEVKAGDYIRYQYGGYKLSYGHEEDMESGGYKYDAIIEPVYYSDLTEEQELDEKIGEIRRKLGFCAVSAGPENDIRLSDISIPVHALDSDYEKLCAIENYICEHVQYDMVHRNKKDAHLKSTAFSAAVYERAVCQGYSELFYRLCMEEGIDCRIITGNAKDPGNPDGEYVYHAWNLVRLGDRYYNVDTTWDAEMQDRKYFMKCDASISDHIRSEEYASEAFTGLYPTAAEDYNVSSCNPK